MLKTVDDISYFFLDVDTLLSDLKRSTTRLARKFKTEDTIDDRLIYKDELSPIAFDIINDFMIEAHKTMINYCNGDYCTSEEVDWNDGKTYYWEINTELEWRTQLEMVSNNLNLAAKAYLFLHWLMDSSPVDYVAELADYQKQERVLKLSLLNGVRVPLDIYAVEE